MPRSDFPEKHQVVLSRTDEDGTDIVYNLEISLPRWTVEDAEKGNVMQQDEVIMAFEKRFRRRFPNERIPEDIVWSDFTHPIIPTIQARP